MGTGSEPIWENAGKTASGELPVPILLQPLSGDADALCCAANKKPRAASACAGAALTYIVYVDEA